MNHMLRGLHKTVQLTELAESIVKSLNVDLLVKVLDEDVSLT